MKTATLRHGPAIPAVSHNLAVASAADRAQRRTREQKVFALALASGLVTGLLFQSTTMALSTFAFIACVGALWPQSGPPVLSFCLGYQWLFAVTGYVYWWFTGAYPGDLVVGNLDGAVTLSVIGLVVIMAGVRTALWLLRGWARVTEARKPGWGVRYSVPLLFWGVVTFFAFAWFNQLNPVLIFFDAAQIIEKILDFRYVLLVMLLLQVFRDGKGYVYALSALGFVVVPDLASERALFLQTFLLVGLAALGAWNASGRGSEDARRRRRLVGVVALVATPVAGMLLLWEGGLKVTWRETVHSEAAGHSPIEQLTTLGGLIRSELEEAASEPFQTIAARQSVKRLSSGAGYFSLVLDRVPALIPHEEGRLTWAAVEHITRPRILFPDKPLLGSASWLVRVYAGQEATGEEGGTSIGLAYMADFYIDFGVTGMFIALFILGVLIGLVYLVLMAASPSMMFFAATAIVVFLSDFTSYEADVAKMLGGLLMKAGVFTALLYAAGPWWHRLLVRSSERGRHPQ